MPTNSTHKFLQDIIRASRSPFNGEMHLSAEASPLPVTLPPREEEFGELSPLANTRAGEACVKILKGPIKEIGEEIGTFFTIGLDPAVLKQSMKQHPLITSKLMATTGLLMSEVAPGIKVAKEIVVDIPVTAFFAIVDRFVHGRGPQEMAALVALLQEKIDRKRKVQNRSPESKKPGTLQRFMQSVRENAKDIAAVGVISAVHPVGDLASEGKRAFLDTWRATRGKMFILKRVWKALEAAGNGLKGQIKQRFFVGGPENQVYGLATLIVTSSFANMVALLRPVKTLEAIRKSEAAKVKAVRPPGKVSLDEVEHALLEAKNAETIAHPELEASPDVSNRQNAPIPANFVPSNFGRRCTTTQSI